jgi:uncharacterized protein (DUF1800 family)
MDNFLKIKHLYSRAGFGLRFADIKTVKHESLKKAVSELLNPAAPDEPLGVVKGNADDNMLIKGDIAAKKLILQQQRQQEKDLNIAWVNQMSTTDAQVREKMTLFWHNHFACRTRNAQYAQQLNNIQRENALGNFRTLLMQVSQSPAMLQFLNNQQNKKNYPNENFARELMELFTIGRGNYTEQDIRESARAFTGWGFNLQGRFIDRPLLHDTGEKTFMGKTGNLRGEDIINRLLEQKQTAVFICTKLYRYLVNKIPDALHVKQMADVFYKEGYEIKPLLEHVFLSDWFYEPKNTGNLIKSPVELIVGLNRFFYITYQRPEVLLQFQKVLGQVLFYPPNVAGWPGGRAWIDSSSLMYRLKIPSTILNGGVIEFTGKADPEDEAYIATRNQQSFVNIKIQAQADWTQFLRAIPKDMSHSAIAQLMLQPALDPVLQSAVMRTSEIKSLAIELASSPEYQMA